MIQLGEAVEALDQIAPTRFAESWDNVGLLVGNFEQRVSRAMLTIDYTQAVAAEGRKRRCDLVVAYHPPIFEALKRVTSSSLIFQAIRDGVAIYSPHTALDVAVGGTNDMLAGAMGLAKRAPLRITEGKTTECKLVTFVPEAQVDVVRDALFEAGVGKIGNYSRCSFMSQGIGTFFGGKETNPAVGKKGQDESAVEVRLETLLPIARLADAIKALKETHPYEEPAFDLVQLAAKPEGLGQGRIGTFASPVPRQEVIRRIKRKLGLKQLLIAGPTKGRITKAACCPGACGNMFKDAMAQGAELYLTGEMRHHDAIRAAETGMTIVCTLHSNSERAVLNRLAKKLRDRLPKLEVYISKMDADPFSIL